MAANATNRAGNSQIGNELSQSRIQQQSEAHLQQQQNNVPVNEIEWQPVAQQQQQQQRANENDSVCANILQSDWNSAEGEIDCQLFIAEEKCE